MSTGGHRPRRARDGADALVPVVRGQAGPDEGAQGPRLTIGRVLALLSPDFPDVSHSKLRFLEAEGLVTPERTGSGYRTYAPSDVERIRYVLTAQRDRFWPLRVIREALDAIDRGLPDPALAPDHRPRAPRPEPVVRGSDLTAPARMSLTAGEVCEGAGVEPGALEDLVTYGLVRPDGDGRYDEQDLAVAVAVGELAGYGVTPRHLRPLRAAAEREVGMVERVLSARGRPRDDEGAGEIAAALLALHAALVRAGLTR